MEPRKVANQNLLNAIEVEFISVVGPIGKLIIEDAKNEWRQKKWQGHAALRNYLKFLSTNIDSKAQREHFIAQTSRLAMEAAAKQQSS